MLGPNSIHKFTAFEMFKTFDTQDAEDNRRFAVAKLPMPLLTIEGGKAMGGALEVQAKMIGSNVSSDYIKRHGTLAHGAAAGRSKNGAKKVFRPLMLLANGVQDESNAK